ncbi:MAG TPA: hypothetical protein VFB22_15595 [Candidatus Baltobacteraceae bacterium]|nr:hypothetical protein [Candidatus Baltobacteraceae bacterium]
MDDARRAGYLAAVIEAEEETQFIRALALIKKGMVWSPEHGLIDFSVPLFGDFMRRKEPVFR